MGLVKPMEEMTASSGGGLRGAGLPPQPPPAGAGAGAERRAARPQPQKEQALNCPRCNSTNTKFCYYNNYSLTQPRYFCKTCRRYWTEGGSLRNVPVGGGSRKNKRPSSSSSSNTSITASATSSSSSSTATATTTTTTSLFPNISLSSPSSSSSPALNPKLLLHGAAQDLNLSFPHHHHHHALRHDQFQAEFPSLESAAKSSGGGLRGLGSTFMPMPMPMPIPMPMPMPMPILEYPTHGFPFPPTLNNFPMDANIGGGSGAGDHGNDHNSGDNNNNDDDNNNDNGGVGGVGGGEYGRIREVQESSRLLFPFEELKPVDGPSSTAPGSNNSDHEQFEHNRGQGVDPSPGFWSGIMGGGGSW